MAAPIVSAELSSSAVTYSPGESQSAVAAGDGIYLVVWVEDYAAPPNIRGMRVRASDGALLDAAPLRISNGMAGWNTHPAVAFDGSNFLVVWENSLKYSRIYGARVRASDGAVLDTSARMLSGTAIPPSPPFVNPLNEYSPAVAFDGTNYLLLWWGDYYSQDYVRHLTVSGNRVRPSDGQLVEPHGFPIVEASGPQVPRVAYGDGRYLVVLRQSHAGQGDDIVGVRIDASSRALLDSTPLLLAGTPENEHDPVLASSGSQFLVSWLGDGGALRGTRVRASDGAVLDSSGLTLSAAPAGRVSVTFDGRDYRAAWQSTRPEGRGLYSTRISPTDGVAAGAELALSGIDPSTADGSGIAATGPGRFLVSYPQRDATTTKDRIKLRRVEDVQPEETCEPGAPTLAINGGSELVLECQPGATYSDPGAQAVDGCGNTVEVHAYNTGTDSSGPGPNLNYEGTYVVSYSAWNAGGSVNASRTVLVDDRTAPTLTLQGPAHMVHTCNSPWVDPGVQATDACYGNLTGSVWHVGEVNGWAEGVYTVRYEATDGGGNSAVPVTRTVEVVDCPW